MVGTYDLESVGDNADGHELLSVVAAVHHQGVGQTLNDGAVSLAESLDSVSASRVRDVDGVAEGDVVTVPMVRLARQFPSSPGEASSRDCSPDSRAIKRT